MSNPQPLPTVINAEKLTAIWCLLIVMDVRQHFDHGVQMLL